MRAPKYLKGGRPFEWYVMQLRIHLLAIVALASGCGMLLNPLIGYERTFKNHIDSMIGENIDDLKREHLGTLHTERQSVNIEGNLTEITFYRYSRDSWSGEPLNCIWIMTTNVNDIVVSWKYVSEPNQCHQPYLHEGPF